MSERTANIYEMEGLTRALFEEAGDALFLVDPDTDELLQVNPMVEKLTGFRQDELLAMPATYFFRYGGQGGRHKLRQATSKSAVFHSQEGFLLRTNQDGVWIPVNLTVNRLHVKPKTLALLTARDVREQHKAHEQLKAVEMELRRVMESVSDCIWSAEIDATGRFRYRYISPVIQKITGRPAAHFLPDLRRWRQVIHPEDQAQWDRAFAQLRAGRPMQEIYRVVWPDGSIHWVRDSVLVSQGANGVFQHLDGVITDITERKEAEEALRTSHAILHAVTEGTTDAVFVKDLEGRYLMINTAGARFLGKTVDEVIGKTDYDLFTPETAQHIVAADRKVLASGQTLTFEDVGTAAGVTRTYLATKGPYLDGQGQIIGLVGIARDITERKRSEEELRASEALYHSLVECLPLNVYRKDLEGRFTFANKRYCELLGKNLEDILGKTDYDFYPRPLAEKYRRDDDEVITTRIVLEDIEEHYLPSGEQLFVQVIKSPIFGPRDEVVGTQGIFWDVTTRKRAEAELRRAKEAAEAASRAKSEFLAKMSHEIRTPMNGIIGMTELTLETDLTPEQRENLEMVRSSAESLLEVISDILDFSKIEAGKMRLEAVEFNIRETLGDVLRSLAMRAQQKGLELACRIEPRVPDVLIGDPARLRQVIVNLVGNAIKFTDRGEVIVNVCLEQRTEDTMDLHFTVADTGIGIPAEKHQIIFEPFEQVDSSAARRYGGTGLGLAISAQLVAMMGGRIWVESEVGKHSIFHFTARLGLPKKLTWSAADVELPSLRDLPVLVVDDNATTRQILEEMLVHWHMRPTVVGSAVEALTAFQKAAAAGTPYPVILVDAVMPEMDGWELVEQLNRSPQLTGAIIMMLRSADRQRSAARCRDLGVTYYVVKPFKRSELLNVFLTALGEPEAACSRQDRPCASPGAERQPSAPTSAERPPSLRILLAEDNLVNQRLARRILERYGHAVVVAGDGQQALAALEQQPFDLVLMDVQMPEMDGYQTTARIREREQKTGRHIPIIALTAHALMGDRERCLAAGMDGYVAKPIRARELLHAIAELVPAAGPVDLPSEPEPLPQVMDKAVAMSRVGGDENLLVEIAGLFLTESPALLSEVHDAIMARDPLKLRRAAHTLKGAVGNFGAQQAFDAALKVELMGRSGDLTAADEAFQDLQTQINRLKPELEDLIARR